jgi:hypothetical protein
MSEDVDTDFSDLDISDDELAELALAADPNAPLDDDAVPFNSTQTDEPALLPAWYMPVDASRVRSDWRGVVALGIAVGLVLCNAFAICVTNGFPSMP